MRKTTLLALAGAFAFASTAFAADPPKTAATGDKPLTPQQQRMKDCNAKAEGKTGDARKQFMSACLSGKDAPAKMTQQDKMKACNAKAGAMKGDERKQFMSSCLSG